MVHSTKKGLIALLVLVLAYFCACGSGEMGNGPIKVPQSAVISRMFSSTLPRPAILPSSAGSQPVLATMFGGFSPQTSSGGMSESQIAQSYESVCDFVSPNGVHAQLGNSGLLVVNFTRGNLCNQIIASVGADEKGNPQGFPVILAGSINTLVAYGNFVSGKHFRCLDTTNTSALQDNAFVRAYYDLAHDAVILGSGSTQLSPTCSITIPAGDDVLNLTVQWLKD